MCLRSFVVLPKGLIKFYNVSDFLTKLLHKVKKPAQPDEENVLPPPEDGTDTEPHESLPDDNKETKDAIKSTPQPLTKRSFPKDPEPYYIKEKTKSIKTKSKIVKRNDTIENRKEEIRRSSTKSTSSRDLRQDSLSSNWSDNIPVITVTKTESSECILESEVPSRKKEKKFTHQERVEIETGRDEELNLQVAEPQCPVSSSSETLVTIKMEESDYEINIDISDKTDSTVRYVDEKGEDSVSKELEETAKILEKIKNKAEEKEMSGELPKSGTDSSHTSQNRTESSSDYQE